MIVIGINKPVLVEWIHGPLFKIYCSFALSSWGDRMWWFAGGIFMKDLSGSKHDSLMLTGVFTFVLSGSVVVFGASVGRWVDNTGRLRAARVALLAQNSLLLLCASTVAFMFYFWDGIQFLWNGNLVILLQCVIVLTAAMSRLASVGTTIIVEKDWIIILADGNLNHLAKINSTFRAIDLAAQIIAPVLVGVIQDQFSKLVSAIIIAAWNVISMIIEYFLLWYIYKENPRLGVKKQILHTARCIAPYAEHNSCPEGSEGRLNFIQYRYFAYCYDWLTYIRHPIRMAGVGLALLYMTVMGFDAVTTAYGNTQLTSSVTGSAQALAAAFGVLASLSFPSLRRRIGLNTVGVMGLGLEVTALIACLVSIWLPGSPFDTSSLQLNWHPSTKNTTRRSPNVGTSNTKNFVSVTAFFGGIIFSRYGLWLSDITITQIMQEQIEENKRGVINGVQDSLNMCMDMVKSLLVIMFPYPHQFGLLIILSFVSIALGFLSYMVYYCSSSSDSQPVSNIPQDGTSSSNKLSEENLTQENVA